MSMKKNNYPVGILVIDDDKQVCDSMERFLEQDGYYVKTLTSPEDTLDAVCSGRFHMVILDLMMPGA